MRFHAAELKKLKKFKTPDFSDNMTVACLARLVVFTNTYFTSASGEGGRIRVITTLIITIIIIKTNSESFFRSMAHNSSF